MLKKWLQDNPSLKEIIDTGDEQFATKVARVTLEEWKLFREVQQKERALQTEGKVRSYEKIKPSMRKRFERRRKEADNGDCFVSFSERY